MKTIKNYEKYSVSRDGSILNSKTNKRLKPYKDTKGYLMVKLYNGIDKKPKAFRIHVLVASVFLDDIFIEKGLKVNHIDGDKCNNTLSNLEIVSQKENIAHAHLIGLSKNRYHKIEQLDKTTGKVVNIFKTIKAISDYFGVATSSVSKGVSKGSYKGFAWRKTENL